MFQGNLFSQIEVPTLTVTQLNHYLKQLLESDELLQKIWVEGEVSNVSRPRSGHIYFTLKDASASLNCVIWKSTAERMRVTLEEGMAVEARGYISVYERGGNYQLYVDSVRVAGAGFLFQEFQRLKIQLEAEGLFDESRKRPLPEFPRVIGIVTSATGAAVQDMFNTFQQRYPLAELVLAPAAVQGEAAPLEIVRAIEALNRVVKPDVIIVGRGGGSIEDLWCFNDERVVRAIAASEAPVISGVGHETDFTLSDFAADLRAPTPTGAAMYAAPDARDLWDELISLHTRLIGLMNGKFELARARFQELNSRFQFSSPARRIPDEMQRLDEISSRLERSMIHHLERTRLHLIGLDHKLHALSPQAILSRGYAVIRHADGSMLTHAGSAHKNEEIDIQLNDGHLKSVVTDIKQNQSEK
ncbi:MAG: exodeoxyribonuclease VII large subunit [Anaerolineaceae bacterium]|nr:exodeoxyribonuclease VII large subunit [Anaerolineaceae bacterium]